MKSLITIVILIFSASLSLAQKKALVQISGLLLDENDKFMPSSTVLLFKADDSTVVKATLSNEAGQFFFTQIGIGTYFVQASAVGYKTLTTPFFKLTPGGNQITLPSMKMTPVSQSLNMVTIAATKPLVTHEGAKTTINVENNILSAGNSAMDILERTPGVIIDKDGNISLNGRQGVAVMINDKLTYLNPAELATLLRSWDGNTIKAIEITTNPSAKYDASGNAGIINIRLKKNSKAGTNGSIVVGAAYGKYGKDNETITLNHKQGKLNLFGTYSHSDNKTYMDINLRRIVVDSSSTTYFNQYSPRIIRTDNNSYRIGLDYGMSPKNRIGVLVSGYFNKENDGNSNDTYIGPSFGKADSSLNTLTGSHQNYHNSSINLNDTYRIDTSGQQISGDIDFTKYLNTANSNYFTNFFLPDGSIQHPASYLGNSTPSVIDIHTAKIDYITALANSLKLETGLKFSDVKTDNNLLQTTAVSVSYTDENHFKYTEKTGAAYFSLSKDYANFSIKAGLRAEYTSSNSTADSLSFVQNNSNHYVDLFPNLFISHRIDNKNEVSFSYGRRIDRPAYDNLNPFTYHFDPYTFLKGNPYLKPQYANNFQLNYIYEHNITFTMGYSIIKDMMTQVPVTDPVTKIAYATQKNLQTQNSLTANVFATYTLTKWWEGNINLTGFYNEVNSNGLNGVNYSASKATLNVRVTESFTPVQGLKAEFTAAYQSPGVFGVFKTGSQYWMDAGISHSFAAKNLNLKLSVSDVFNTQRFRNSVIFGSDMLTATVKPETQLARLTLTYNFGNIKIKSNNHQTGAEDAKARVKGAN